MIDHSAVLGMAAHPMDVIDVSFDGHLCRFDGTPVRGLEKPGVIYEALLKGRFYEQPFLEYIRSLGIAGVYVDAGSCIGTHALFFALMCPATRVLAFEPRDFLHQRILDNVDLNGVGSIVEAFPFALSDRTESVEVNLDRQDWILQCRRLDDVVSGRVDLIKIDVEGMEPRVLDGAANVLRRWRPRVFAEAGDRQRYEELVACMARHGYEPTGRVFNATPTYEFVPRPGRVRATMRRLADRYPLIGRPVRRLRRRLVRR